jgi:hypothetical protein
MARQAYNIAERAWQDAGRPGKPRFVTAMYYGLGPNAAEGVAAYIHNYYPEPLAGQIVKAVPTTPEAVKGAFQAFANVGADELICWPCIPDLDQVDRLADLIG